MKKEEVESFYRALRDINVLTMETLVKEYIGKGIGPISILNEGLIGWQVDAKMTVEVGNQEMSLIRNIANKNVLWGGTPEDVYRQARYSIEAGVDILAPECAVPLQTAIENLKAIVEAAKDGYRTQGP